MYSRQLGFGTSWKMLTRDKGWIKPVLVLTLVGWIPILGQIAIMGYGLEWARLTAWGVDSAPKQRGVAYGKVLSTGGIAFLIMVTMGLVLGVIDVVLFGGWYPIAAFPMGISALSGSVLDAVRDVSVIVALAMVVVNLLLGSFTTAAMMRATIYDSFGAGWRLDRLFQMIARDLGGFLHAYAVTLIGGAVSAAYGIAMTLIGGVFAFSGFFGLALGVGMAGERYIGTFLSGMGPGIVVLAVVLIVLAAFVGSVISTAMQLIAINAMGQWFCRFDVARWGVSSAPLPDGVPAGGAGWGGSKNQGMPVQPEMPTDEPEGQGQAVPQQPAGQTAAPEQAPQDFSYRDVPAAAPETTRQPEGEQPVAPQQPAAPAQPAAAETPTDVSEPAAEPADAPAPAALTEQPAASPIITPPPAAEDAGVQDAPAPAAQPEGERLAAQPDEGPVVADDDTEGKADSPITPVP
ncbi:DUF4013 domain-containing protein [Collinsella tanakaei]|uniref:DUF4013 domain-containing protein n=1 Tax=Collinsella tanakaei TaxID=626935 RepID=UPI00195976E0|nr:DUF4013 domain-containing protein [Collinsella tanakaei]MBM6756534.1 DUF4013 domain-containing protein [Collinsella tanakaei]